MPPDDSSPAHAWGRFPSGALPGALSDLVAALESGPARAIAATAEQAAVAAAAVAAALDAPLVLLTPTPVLAERVASVVRWLLHAGPTPYSFPRWPRGADSPYEEVVEGPFTAAARSGALAHSACPTPRTRSPWMPPSPRAAPYRSTPTAKACSGWRWGATST